MYVTNGIDNVIDDFRNSRPGSKKVLITVSDGYTHPSIQASDVQNKLRKNLKKFWVTCYVEIAPTRISDLS